VVFLTACLLGSAAAYLGSLFALISLALSIPVLFAISVLVSGQLSLWPLLLAIAGLNAGLMLPFGILLVQQGRSRRLI
jgi:cytochrome c biogenesis protein CcdA